MEEVRGEILQDRIVLHLKGSVNTENAQDVEKEVRNIVEGTPEKPIEIDAEELSYISSAGLRVILRLRKDCPDIKITGVSLDVYEILDMTGFTQMMPVEKAYKRVSIEGAEEIGRGANGIVYRIDQDKVVKVYHNEGALADIQHEREVARKALILGIPTAISYDVVKVGDKYGSVFELLNATSFSEILENEPEKIDWCVQEYTNLLKLIHNTVVPKGELPDFRQTVINWTDFLKDYLPEAYEKKLHDIVEAVPYSDHMIHGDYHTKNVVLAGDEVLLLDMDTLAVGHPIFELGCMYNAFVGFSEYDHEVFRKFQGFDRETGVLFWHKVLAAYIGTKNEDKLKQVEDKARIVGYTRMIRRSIRRGGLETETGRAEIDLWKRELIELLDRVETLSFTCNEIEVEAVRQNLSTVLDFLDVILKETNCPAKARMQIDLAVEEIFVNIADYAYRPGKGNAIVRVEVSEDPISVTITFIDKGKPFDPLSKDDPDVTLKAEDRAIGGLGIFMTKQIMDALDYEYKDGRNIFTLKKNF